MFNFKIEKKNVMQEIKSDRNYKYFSKIPNGKRSALDKKIIEPAEVVEVDESDDNELAVGPSDEIEEDSVGAVTVDSEPSSSSSFTCVSADALAKTAKTSKINKRRRCIFLFLRMLICCFQQQCARETSVIYLMKKENIMEKLKADRNYKYLSKIPNGKKSALDRKIIEPPEVVEVDESDDDELAEDPSDEIEEDSKGLNDEFPVQSATKMECIYDESSIELSKNSNSFPYTIIPLFFSRHFD
ncbi:hypothetical protein ACTXT7_015924 [Hymenolepis weldensis]